MKVIYVPFKYVEAEQSGSLHEEDAQHLESALHCNIVC
ncbi:hypothetical protein KNP414_01822 [Paenibacillus mucilaginosus KNP414]|uniref:Uncharacterized protein n=1 Tax=Paenibacillus mucilaginosus (strain KNP414) TaxID=1036673 RepID=F8FQM9_PAEMK|nr:hypothetical protein KNP414_01822 [Paenibacillus mucilaginosus KNP414]